MGKKKIFLNNKNHSRLYEICQEQLCNSVYQVRFFCSLLTGYISSYNEEYLDLIRYGYCKDDNWRVQEANAKAFNIFCELKGYEESKGIINEWIKDKNENVRRAVTEGLRVWTSKPYFKDHPQEAIKILSILKSDKSLYVQKSVANCFSDISKYYPDLVIECFGSWNYLDKSSMYIIKRGCRHIKDNCPDKYRVLVEKMNE